MEERDRLEQQRAMAVVDSVIWDSEVESMMVCNCGDLIELVLELQSHLNIYFARCRRTRLDLLVTTLGTVKRCAGQ